MDHQRHISGTIAGMTTIVSVLVLLLLLLAIPITVAAEQSESGGGVPAGQSDTSTDSVTATLVINGGAVATTAPTVTLAISGTSTISDVIDVRLKGGGTAWGAWQPYTNTIQHTLPATDGIKYVTLQVRDAADNVSSPVTDSIRLDTAAGTALHLSIANDAAWTNSAIVSLTIGAPAFTAHMQIRNDTAFTDTAWQPFATRPTWTLTTTAAYTLPRTVYARVRRTQTLSPSTPFSDSIMYDPILPTGTVHIETVEVFSLQVQLTATDQSGLSGLADMRVGLADTFASAEWEPFTITKMLTSATPLTHPVRVNAQFRDGAGNASALYSAATTGYVFLPVVTQQAAVSGTCTPINGEAYAAIIPENRTDRPAAEHPDLNLAIRGYVLNQTAERALVDYDGASDSNAPQLYGLFADERIPDFSATYRVYQWDWECDCKDDLITDWDVTLAGMQVTPGEPLYVPDSGYTIGALSGNYEVLVLYASEDRITLKYTRDDNVIEGYTLHVEGVCVEPRLLELYETWNAAGRTRLPALHAGQAFGRARSDEIGVAIRDNGMFMDPRSRKDWWQGR